MFDDLVKEHYTIRIIKNNIVTIKNEGNERKLALFIYDNPTEIDLIEHTGLLTYKEIRIFNLYKKETDKC